MIKCSEINVGNFYLSVVTGKHNMKAYRFAILWFICVIFQLWVMCVDCQSPDGKRLFSSRNPRDHLKVKIERSGI